MEAAQLTVGGKAIVVPLTQGKFALVDLDVWPVIQRHQWHAKYDRGRWYASTCLGRGVKMHQMIFGLRRGWDIDHKNRNPLDNRRQNLRWATRQQNAANGKHRNSNTGYRGAYFDRSKGRFVAKIARDGKLWNIGHYDDPVSAARAYDRAAKATYGEFAVLNFPEQEE